MRGRRDIDIVACVCGNMRSDFSVPFVSSTSVRGSVVYTTITSGLKLSTRSVSGHVTRLRPITVQLRMGINRRNYALVGSDCGDSVGSLSVTLSFVGHHPSRHNHHRALVLDSVCRDNRAPRTLCGRIDSLTHGHNMIGFVNVNPRLYGRRSAVRVSRGFFFPGIRRFVGDRIFTSLHSRIVLLGNTHRFNFSRLARLLIRGIRRAALRIGLGTIITGLGCCHTFVGPRAGLIYVVGTSNCNTKTMRVTGALRSRHMSCLTITITSRNIALHGGNVADGVVVVGPRVATFGAVFSCSLRPRICSFQLLSTLVGTTRGRNIAKFPIRVGLSANVRHVNFSPRGSVRRLVNGLGRRGTVVPHSIFSRFIKDSSSDFSRFSTRRFRLFSGKDQRLRTTFSRGVLHRVYGSTNVRRFPRHRLSVYHLNLKLCNVGSHGGGAVGYIDALGAAVLRVRGIGTNSDINCDHGAVLSGSDIVTTVPVKCTSNLGHHLNGHRTCYLIGNRGTSCMNGVYVSITVVSIANVGYGRNSDIRVFNRRLPIRILDSVLRAVPCRILAAVDGQIGEICCRSWE